MGRIIANKVRGMNWTAKISLILIFTLVFSTFMYQGLWKPKFSLSVTVTRNFRQNTGTSVGADGSTNWVSNATTTPTLDLMDSTVPATSLRTIPALTTTPTVVYKAYSPAITQNTTIAASAVVNLWARETTAITCTETLTYNLYDYNPTGVAGNGTLIGTVTVTTSTLGATTVTNIPGTLNNGSYNLTASVGTPKRLRLEVVASSSAAVNFRIYSGTGTSSSLVTDETVTADVTLPTVSTVAVASGTTVDVTFSEAMGTGVTTGANYTVSGTGKGTLANNPNSVALVSGNTYKLTWSAGEMFNAGNITITVANAQDVAGNAIGTPNSGTHTGGAIGVAPTVTINQAGGQADPTSTSPINFTVVFSESTTTFAIGDVTITGTAGGTKTATVTGSGTIYNVAVTGMTTTGTVTASINSVVAADAAGNGNAASTSTDNTVQWTPVVNNPLLHNSVNTGSAKWGMNGWGIAGGRYGAFVCETCHAKSTTNIKRVKTTITSPNAPTNTFPGSAVTFSDTRNTTSDFGDDTGAHATSTKVCEVCHTYDATQANGVKFHAYNMSAGGADLTHNNKTDCMPCHVHSKGFKASCDSCHGNPPIDATAGGPSGLANSPYATGSVTAGAHNKHTAPAGLNYACTTCHNGYAMPTTASTFFIDISFNVLGTTTGTYDGQTTVRAYSPPNTKTGTLTCSSVYCHSSGQSANGLSATPVYSTPTWTGTAACGSCHAIASMATGSHIGHLAVSTNCGLCHSGASAVAYPFGGTHVNKLIDVAAGVSYSASGTPGNGYGTCSTANCHANVYGTGSSITPTWGSTGNGCSACHSIAIGVNGPATGSHTAHAGKTCISCHNAGTTATTTPNTGHIDGNIDVTSGYPANVTKHAAGSGYSTCSNVYCHGNYPGSGKNATPTWGIAASAACGTCHGAGNTETTRPASGSHERHVSNWITIKNPYSNDREYACTLCHRQSVNGTLNNYTIADTSTHVNTYVETSFDTGDPRLSGTSSYSIVNSTQAPSDGISRAYGTCTNVYCHSNVQGINGVGAPTSYDTVQWGAPKHADPINVNSVVNCLGETSQCHVPAGSSHSVAINTGSHTKHMQYTFGMGGWARTCGACHKWEPTGISCSSCHVTPGEKAYHVNGIVDILFEQNVTNNPTIVRVGASATYNDNTATPGAPGNGYFSCSNTYCHSAGTSVSTGTIPSNITVTWGTPGSLACISCHTGGTATGPTYSSGSPKANSHNKHVVGNGYKCADCHSAVVDASGAIINTANHVNAFFDVSGVRITSYTFATDGGTCATYCHGTGTPKWGGAVVCGDCHAATNATLTTGSHATHLTALKGPNGVNNTTVTCDTCHGIGAVSGTHTGHTNGLVAFADGNVLASTNVCDTCHSPGGLYDGVNAPVIGAKANWTTGVYTGTVLSAGKDKWCATCHDLGVSVIGGRQAPDVVGDDLNYGYYASGHGSKTTGCDGCHGLEMNHNFDNKKTYLGASNNYQAGFRLKDTLTVPLASASCNSYNKDNYKLCYNCHSEANLMSDTKDRGCYDCPATPTNFKNAPAIVTNFRNTHPQGHNTGTGINDMPANFHADHLIDVRSFGSFWYSDGPGTTTGTSAVTCTTCHNPHGEKLASSNTSAPRMTRGYYDISINNTDANGQYGQINGTGWYSTCSFACHGAGEKWYKNSVPYMQGITVADNNSTDPAAAEANFTNNRTIGVTLRVSGVATEMMFAENAAFTTNQTVWLPFAASSTYTLTAAEGAKTVYAKTRNSFGESNTIQSLPITLDTTPPTVPATALTSPNGTEVWDQGTSRNITWSGITDTYLKAAPVSLSYSTDSGSSYPNSVSSVEANDGTYAWSLPLINSTTVRVKLTATDRAGNQSSDTSNSNFTIQAVTPNITSYVISDNNSADPAPAEAGYTNTRDVNVAISASNYPTEMVLAENSGFTLNSTGWIPYSASYTYTLTNSDASKTVYLKLRNAVGESGTSSYAIILDRVSPTILGTTLTAPNGAEQWMEGETTRQITWVSGNITDTYLKASPITLTYSVDAGGTYPYTIAGTVANSGSYTWNPIPKPASYQARVRITATDRAGNQSSDSSNADFIIKPLYIVTNTNDSGAGSLRQAMTDLIAAGGNDSIWFDIPDGSLTNGVGVIGLNTVLPTITAPGITIDGGSQAILHPATTNPRGPEIRLHGNIYAFDGLTLSADNAKIKGLQFTNFYFDAINITSGSNAVIEGNHIGFWSDNANNYTGRANYYGVAVSGGGANHWIGGTAPEAANYISGNVRDAIDAYGPSVSIVNNSIGLLPNGADMSNGAFYNGIYLASGNSLVQGNRISGSYYSSGIDVRSSNVTIKGNIFGLYYDGVTWSARTAPQMAIRTFNSSVSNLVVGGPNVAADDANLNDSNVISTTAGYGVYVYGNFTNPAKIYGNFIGTNPGKTETFTGNYGIYLDGLWGTKTVIGGSGAGEAGNVIANMSANGVYVKTNATGVKISRNSFFNNGTNAAASDDAIYVAPGANLDVTRPVISSADVSTVTVSGVESGDTIEVYISDYDGSGTEYGEGRTFIGSAVAGGTTAAVPVSGVSVGQWVTALRIKATGDTSAFSANIQVQ